MFELKRVDEMEEGEKNEMMLMKRIATNSNTAASGERVQGNRTTEKRRQEMEMK